MYRQHHQFVVQTVEVQREPKQVQFLAVNISTVQKLIAGILHVLTAISRELATCEQPENEVKHRLQVTTGSVWTVV